MIDPGNPTNSWCVSNCGLCFELCTTGGTHNGESANPGECIVVQLENRCGDGYGEASNYLCGQNLSPWECLADPGHCQEMKSTNMYGYPAYFDLQNAALQITDGLGWHNPEVTLEIGTLTATAPMLSFRLNKPREGLKNKTKNF